MHPTILDWFLKLFDIVLYCFFTGFVVVFLTASILDSYYLACIRVARVKAKYITATEPEEEEKKKGRS